MTAARPRRAAATLRTLAITSGEPAGIGPDICSQVLDSLPRNCRVVLIGDATLFGRARGRRAPGLQFKPFDLHATARAGVELLHIPLRAPCQPGVLDTANARYVLDTLDAAVGGCAAGAFDGIVTAPVQKSIINDAGIRFSGHTEYLARRTGAPLPVMMLVGGGMRVALATTHLPLRKVSAALKPQRLDALLRIVHTELNSMFGVRRPRIVVLGLNPHAGESGHLGREEIDLVEPVLAQLRHAGLNLIGPVPADTAFLPDRLQNCDAIVAMYHDQGLPVLKHASFGHAVNVTLGLPIIRTSVDHGTALDLAGTPKADAGSLQAAFALALDLCRRGKAGAFAW